MSSLVSIDVDDFAQDFRYGLRTLWKHKGFTLSVVLTLALALGTTTTLFSIVSAALYTRFRSKPR